VSPSFCVSLGSSVISLTGFGAGVTNLNEPPRAFATSTIAWVRRALSLLGKQKQPGLRGLCRWPSITELKMHITVQGPAVSEMTYTVSSGTLNSTIPYHAGVERIDPLRFLAGCRKRRLNQALSDLTVSLGYFECVRCAGN